MLVVDHNMAEEKDRDTVIIGVGFIGFGLILSFLCDIQELFDNPFSLILKESSS